MPPDPPTRVWHPPTTVSQNPVGNTGRYTITLLSVRLHSGIETTVNLRSASFVVIMHLHEGLTHIQSQIKPWLLLGESFSLIMHWKNWDRSCSPENVACALSKIQSHTAFESVQLANRSAQLITYNMAIWLSAISRSQEQQFFFKFINGNGNWG